MTNALKPYAMNDLYPPECPRAIRDLIDTLPTGEKDENGKHILSRRLVALERGDLIARGKALEKWLVAGDRRELKKRIAEMMLGFAGGSMSEDEANAIVSQYVVAGRELPHFAVARACARFASGTVRPEEIGEKELSRTYRPTSAQLCILAGKIAEPYVRERWKLAALLNGVVARPASTLNEEEKAAFVEKQLADFVQKKEINALEAATLDAQRRERAAIAKRQEIERRRREYRDAGLAPPAGPIPASLPMMLKMGYSIVTFPDGKRALVSPAGRAGAEEAGHDVEDKLVL